MKENQAFLVDRTQHSMLDRILKKQNVHSSHDREKKNLGSEKSCNLGRR